MIRAVNSVPPVKPSWLIIVTDGDHGSNLLGRRIHSYLRRTGTIIGGVETDFRLARFSRRLLDAADDDSRYRLLMHDVPRRFHQLTRELQVVAIERILPP